jgi:hypothetical protein
MPYSIVYLLEIEKVVLDKNEDFDIIEQAIFFCVHRVIFVIK